VAGELPGIAKAPSPRTPCYLSAPPAEPNDTLWSTTHPVSLFAPGDGVHRHRGSHEEFRFIASWFSDVRSYEWDLLVSEVSGDLAYTVAIERCTASRNSRPPAPTELRVTQEYRREG
jgi:hypothetical protein